jgi:hypothetical protein
MSGLITGTYTEVTGEQRAEYERERACVVFREGLV